MAQFYKELKELRISKEISLEDLQSKTKININYLNAIEEGNFEILPTPYLRLFIRAYALEIGGDAERALEQLDSFVGNTRQPKKSLIINIEKEDTGLEEKFKFLDLLSGYLKKFSSLLNKIFFTLVLTPKADSFAESFIIFFILLTLDFPGL